MTWEHQLWYFTERVYCVCVFPLCSVAGHRASPKSQVYMELDSCPLHKGPEIKITQDCLNITLIQFVSDSNLIVVYITLLQPQPAPREEIDLWSYLFFAANQPRLLYVWNKCRVIIWENMRLNLWNNLITDSIITFLNIKAFFYI